MYFFMKPFYKSKIEVFEKRFESLRNDIKTESKSFDELKYELEHILPEFEKLKIKLIDLKPKSKLYKKLHEVQNIVDEIQSALYNGLERQELIQILDSAEDELTARNILELIYGDGLELNKISFRNNPLGEYKIYTTITTQQLDAYFSGLRAARGGDWLNSYYYIGDFLSKAKNQNEPITNIELILLKTMIENIL